MSHNVAYKSSTERKFVCIRTGKHLNFDDESGKNRTLTEIFHGGF